MDEEELKKINTEVEGQSPDLVLKKAFELFGEDIALASSFGVEDNVLIHIAHQINPKFKVFTLDTARLPEETYVVMEAIRVKYNINIETYFPNQNSVEQLVREKGFYSFRDSVEARKECCFIRKVEPLNRALSAKKAWITGIRKDQIVTRSQMNAFEPDPKHAGLIKVNPLINWTETQVKDFAEQNQIPMNALFKQKYRSIGCAPCTRAVSDGEDERAGRWWWESPDKKECGLHQ
ncbi:MAG: phosphoadenosine phosphosulfate reductase [Candidatus Omnitrophota bacterium]|jgi:phosphoadenosine phosphosulfate reductase